MIVLYNPKAGRTHRRLPLSLLALAGELEGKREWTLVDGNLDSDPLATLEQLIAASATRPILAVTVMPGPQLAAALPHCETLRKRFDRLVIVWGGYFPSDHPEVTLATGPVDYVIRGNGESTFLSLIEAIEMGSGSEAISGVSYSLDSPDTEIPVGKEGVGLSRLTSPVQVDFDGTIIRHNQASPIPDPNLSPAYPYEKVPVESYVSRTYLGSRTVNHHSSYGCPFTCNFCSVVVTYQARWKSESSERTVSTVRHLHDRYGADSVEFHDNNFFVSEARVREIADGIEPTGMSWWGEARSDTLLKYSDATWDSMRRSGCRMVFTGAESGSDAKLSLMNKGGTQSSQTILEAARRFREYDIVPEFSFVLGTPPDAGADIRENIEFIRRIKRINPRAEIILYLYTPVPLPGLYDQAVEGGFGYPRRLSDWVEGDWGDFSRRRSPHTPWVREEDIRLLEGFETVLNARYPTATDIQVGAAWRRILGALGALRWELGLYKSPRELSALLRLLRYRRPEEEGFPQQFEEARI